MDACVTIALTFVAVALEAPVTRFVDLGGSLIVTAYLVINGIMTIHGSNNTIIIQQQASK